MAIVIDGIYGPIIGKVGNKVYSYRNRKQYVREIKPRTKEDKEPTPAQLAVREKFALITKCLSSMREILNIGFRPASPSQKWKGAFGLAVSYNYKYAFTDRFPDLRIDYPRLKFCRGNLKTATNMDVQLEATGLRFKWDCDSFEALEYHFHHRILMLVHFPKLNRTEYAFGADRKTCTDIFSLEPKLRKKHMEVYMAFISADEKHTSNSVHVGTFNFKGK